MQYHRSTSSVSQHALSFSLAAIIAVIGVIGIPLFGHASILINGSFESGFTGWTTTGINNVLLRTTANFPATEGQNMINFNGGETVPNGTLSQSVPTLTGQSYTIAFDFGNWGNYLPVTQGLRVKLQGNALLDQRDVIDSTISSSQNPALVYNPFSYTFVADSVLTTLTFTDIASSTTSSDGLLDNVRITAVPEPSALVLGGFGLLILFRARRANAR